MVHNSIISGMSRQELDAGGHMHRQEQRENACMLVCPLVLSPHSILRAQDPSSGHGATHNKLNFPRQLTQARKSTTDKSESQLHLETPALRLFPGESIVNLTITSQFRKS